jgi:hypothetical protein
VIEASVTTWFLRARQRDRDFAARALEPHGVLDAQVLERQALARDAPPEVAAAGGGAASGAA